MLKYMILPANSAAARVRRLPSPPVSYATLNVYRNGLRVLQHAPARLPFPSFPPISNRFKQQISSRKPFQDGPRVATGLNCSRFSLISTFLGQGGQGTRELATITAGELDCPPLDPSETI